MASSKDIAGNDRLSATPVDELVGDMTGDDIAFVLRDIRFRGGLHTIRLDKEARQFLLDAVLARIKPPR
jgi:hypothetical protein